jgi:CheY-like chemotaxis protein
MRTILVVDDSPTIRKMVRTALGSLTDVGFIEAASGLQAIETLAIHQVQMVVLDLNMADMHGLDVLRVLRSHSQTFAEGHLGDGRVARGRVAGPSHGERASRNSPGRCGSRWRETRHLLAGANALEAVIVARRQGLPMPSQGPDIAALALASSSPAVKPCRPSHHQRPVVPASGW